MSDTLKICTGPAAWPPSGAARAELGGLRLHPLGPDAAKLRHRDPRGYIALPKAQQADLKDVGGFVGGTLRNGSRKRGCCTGRSLITLDMDNCAPGSTEDWVAAIKSIGTAAVYSTRKHDPEHPRLRAIFPTDRVMQPEEYQLRPDAGPDAGRHDGRVRLHHLRAERLMYWPSRSADSDWVCEATEDGSRICVDDLLWPLPGLARRPQLALPAPQSSRSSCPAASRRTLRPSPASWAHSAGLTTSGRLSKSSCRCVRRCRRRALDLRCRKHYRRRGALRQRYLYLQPPQHRPRRG